MRQGSEDSSSLPRRHTARQGQGGDHIPIPNTWASLQNKARQTGGHRHIPAPSANKANSTRGDSQGLQASGTPCGKGISCPPRGRWEEHARSQCQGLACFMYPIRRAVGVPRKALGLCQPLPPCWASKSSSHPPGSSRTSHPSHNPRCKPTVPAS